MESSKLRGSGSRSGTSRSGPKNLLPISLDLKSGLSMQKNESLILSPPTPMPSPVSSLSNLGKQVGDIQISDRKYPINGWYDSSSDSNNDSKYDASDDRSLSDGSDVPETPMFGSSPSLPSAAKLRSCDVYIGVPSSKPNILRFAKWLRAELELQGVSCFAVDRRKCKDAVGHNAVERALQSASFGVVIVSKQTFSNPYSMYELRIFLSKKNLVPIFFNLSPGECIPSDIISKRGEVWGRRGDELWKSYGGTEDDWKESVNALSLMDGWNLEARPDCWRDCISETIKRLGTKLGRRNVVDRVRLWMDREKEEFPFPRNGKFIGRKKELLELEILLFGELTGDAKGEHLELHTAPRRKKESSARTKGKEVNEGRESDVIEIESNKNFPRNGSRRTRKPSSRSKLGKGAACVSGDRGIGKTELVLEFAYRLAQRYRMVLWLGGEARFIRQNYLKLMSLFEIDPTIDNQVCLDGIKPKNFEEQEGEAISTLRKEFMRDIPFLIVIDNLEREEDWWDAKSIMELLPRFGGETHIVISTRLRHVTNIEPIKLSYLSDAESISLMKGRLQNITLGDIGALQCIEEKLGRLTFGLALVGGIVSEHSISPQALLDALNQMPDSELVGREDKFFRRNPFLVRLIELCFVIFDQVDESASRMALSCGWFAPSPIPISVLEFAASKAVKTDHKNSIWRRSLCVLTSQWRIFQKRRSGDDSCDALVRLGFARDVTKQGYIQFHEIVKSYSRKRGDTGIAYAMVQALNVKGSFPEHSEHIWSACFLLFSFGPDPALLKPKMSMLVAFIKNLALPLGVYTFTRFSQCNTAMELLRLCSNALDEEDETLFSGVDKVTAEPSCWVLPYTPSREFIPFLYTELATLKATLLEKRAELMLKGGDNNIAQELCKKAISIREIINGWDHPETLSARNTFNNHLLLEEYYSSS